MDFIVYFIFFISHTQHIYIIGNILSFGDKLVKSMLKKAQDCLKKQLVQNPFAQNEKAEMVHMLKASIIAIVALVVIVTLGVAIIPGSVTSLSNTSAITGYTTWSTGTQAIWIALAVFVVLVFLLILVSILLAVLG